MNLNLPKKLSTGMEAVGPPTVVAKWESANLSQSSNISLLGILANYHISSVRCVFLKLAALNSSEASHCGERILWRVDS